MSPLYLLSNPLATPEQLLQSASSLDGLAGSLIDSIRYHGALLTQAAGILLRLPQETIAQAIVTFARFYVGPEGGSFRVHAARDISAASIYLTGKLSATPLSPRAVLNVYAYLLSPHSPLSASFAPASKAPPPSTSYTATEGEHLSARATLLASESLLLQHLSFTTTTRLPHALALTYLQTLSALPTPPTSKSSLLASRTLQHLNAALLSPQLLYLTHQPNVLAVAAVYLAAREVGVRLVGEGAGEWWRVWDVGREELGFVVVGMGSLEGWVRREREEGRGRGTRCLLTVGDVEGEMMRESDGEEDGERS